MKLTLDLDETAAALLQALAARAGLTPEAWLRAAIIAHGGTVTKQPKPIRPD